MASKRLDKLREWIARHSLLYIGEPEFASLVRDLEIPEPALRRLLRETGIPLHPLVEGVRQDSFDHLARTLVALQHEYETAPPNRARKLRALVITAKDHARLAARRNPEKLEMVNWMLVWLENPPVFETWLKLRLSERTRESTGK